MSKTRIFKLKLAIVMFYFSLDQIAQLPANNIKITVLGIENSCLGHKTSLNIYILFIYIILYMFFTLKITVLGHKK
jgi:hypothetical protein